MCGRGRLREVPTVGIWLGKIGCFRKVVAYGRWSHLEVRLYLKCPGSDPGRYKIRQPSTSCPYGLAKSFELFTTHWILISSQASTFVSCLFFIDVMILKRGDKNKPVP